MKLVPNKPPEAEVHNLGLNLANAELDVAVASENKVHIHDDLVPAHVLLVHLDAGDTGGNLAKDHSFKPGHTKLFLVVKKNIEMSLRVAFN